MMMWLLATYIYIVINWYGITNLFLWKYTFIEKLDVYKILYYENLEQYDIFIILNF